MSCIVLMDFLYISIIFHICPMFTQGFLRFPIDFPWFSAQLHRGASDSPWGSLRRSPRSTPRRSLGSKMPCEKTDMSGLVHQSICMDKKTGWWLTNPGPTPLKNDGVKVSWDYDIPNIWKGKKCSKPPTRIIRTINVHMYIYTYVHILYHDSTK
jgi:hypothetical protein